MSRRVRAALLVTAAGLAIVAGSGLAAPLVAQSVFAQLGLTEASARSFLFDELKSPTDRAGRRTRIAVTGHRAFYKLPPATRGPAATALFAWARAYVNSPVFRTAYAEFRRDANPVDPRAAPSADAEMEKQKAEMQAGMEMALKIAASLPPADRDKLLATLKEQQAQMTEALERMSKMVALEQAEQAASNKASANRFEDDFPADLNRLVARRLRTFLDDTADADFTARVIRLTDGPDGMEFIEPADRAKSTTWQLAVLAGPEATTAARAAAEAWLKEITP